MLRNDIDAWKSKRLKKILSVPNFTKIVIFRKAQIMKKIKHFHQEGHSKASEGFRERRKKTERKRNVKE